MAMLVSSAEGSVLWNCPQAGPEVYILREQNAKAQEGHYNKESSQISVQS